MFESELAFAIVDEAELNDLASGKARPSGQRWPLTYSRPRLSNGSFGVLYEEAQDPQRPVRPLAIIADPSAHRRLYVRFSQVRSDLSPLSAWCHVLSPASFEMLDTPIRRADLGPFEAAWAGLAIAEAAILSGRPLSQVKVAACLATRSFAIGRTLALWPNRSLPDVLSDYEELQRNVRLGGSSGMERVRASFEPIWQTLAACASPDAYYPTRSDAISAVLALVRAREHNTDETSYLREVLSDFAEARVLSGLAELGPEGRLRIFDKLVQATLSAKPDSDYRTVLSFLSGYIATVAAGGSASLGLAEDVSQSLPEVAGWAYVIGGLGERVTWTGGFNGLGRLVSRELTRPFNVAEPPAVDFSAEEASALVDKQLSDPLVHLQVKQSRVVAAALYPGVNLQVPFAEPASDNRNSRARDAVKGSNDPMSVLADALLPLLVSRLQPTLDATNRPPRRGTRYGRKAAQSDLLTDKD